MDRNSIIGLVLIGVLIIAYSIYTQPNEAEVRAMKHKRDSVAALQLEQEKMQQEAMQRAVVIDTTSLAAAESDSAKKATAEQQLGAFASAGTGEEKTYILENDLLVVTVSSKGGRIKSVEL